MSIIDMDKSSLQAFMTRLQAIMDDAPALSSLAVEAVAAEAMTLIVAATPYDAEADNGTIPDEEGHLNESYSVTPASDDVVSEAQVMTSEPIKYGYVTGGTMDVGPIMPVQAKGLWWPSAAHPFKQVSGQEANPFQQQVLTDINDELDDLVSPIIQIWIGVP
jgi:hypothetical protein